MKIASGTMCWWRYKGVIGPYYFGYATWVDGPGRLIRMGRYNGDTTGGSVVDNDEIEVKPYA